MTQLARQLDNQIQETTPSAADSIQAMRSLFDGSATRKAIKKFYDSQPDKTRGLILIAGGLSPKDFQRSFDDFTDLELHKIRKGMHYLKDVVIKFDRKFGDVRKLRHYQFSSTH
ncbi:hypothetical protein L3Q72_19805 [Vibrio sp. JC009]|uniref:hypothetical protein n=1 Tax=Vibrio sp. JC009 TaxID=2912314 RepID=UPI0023AED419|nr:hypothetical protein [Vibrio sp. JC009]WED23487.1 hypothetical protein L3Q72_19805 [Vibrio sp. JC009]